ncbi:MAG TPA: aquaporin [Candidatus Limnocylindrales bacterium]
MDRKLVAALVGEGFGTFLFVFIGAGSIVLGGVLGSPSSLVAVALAHGIALAVVVTAFAAVSGGHINPAVTVAIWISGGIEAVTGVLYVVAQLLGAAVAGFLLRAVFAESAWQPSILGIPAMMSGIDPTTGLVLEIVMTMVLVIAVFGTAVDPRAPRLGGLLIGLSITADIFVGGPITGAAMNPARWFGPAVATGDYTDWWVWVVGPIVGGAIVALLYRFVFAPRQVLVSAEETVPR